MVIKDIKKINQICRDAKAYISIDRNIFILFTDIYFDEFNKGYRVYYNYSFYTYGIDAKINAVQEAYK